MKRSDAQIRWSTKNKKRVLKTERKYSRTPKARFSYLKHDAKRRNLSMTISYSNFIELIDHPCFYCNGYFKKSETGCGLDRIDNNGGYDPHNVVSCCTTCNRTRGDRFTPLETIKLIEAVISHRKTNNYE